MLEEQINKDYVKAMKERDSLRSSTLSFLRAQLKNVIIDRRVDKLEDPDVIVVLKKQVKQRQDSIEQYTKGDRKDLADKEQAELDILQTYLPEEMSEEALKGLVDETVKEVGAQSMKDMGQVMKALMPKVEGRADNKLVSQLVKNSISSI